MIPTGGAPVPIAFGYHPYLRLPGVDRSRWELALPPRRKLELDARKLPTGAAQARPAERFALGDRAFDDSFDGIADGAAFTIAGGGRAIAVTHHAGYPVAQVFSPRGRPVRVPRADDRADERPAHGHRAAARDPRPAVHGRPLLDRGARPLGAA